MWWTLGAVENAVVMVVYFAIAGAILLPLVRSRQLRSNALGAATAAIFFTCAVHHGAHTVHMLLPYLGVGSEQGLAMRDAFTWHSVVWDGTTALVGIYYWTLRRTYGPLMRGAKLFEDLKERQRQALELNDNVVQGLVTAQMALELDERERSHEALVATLRSARTIISDLVGEAQGSRSGELVRGRAATVAAQPAATAEVAER